MLWGYCGCEQLVSIPSHALQIRFARLGLPNDSLVTYASNSRISSVLNPSITG